MPTYQFVCAVDGVFERRLPMSRCGEPQVCPACGERGRRRFAAPGLRFGDATARRLLDATTATADAPPVVSQLPPRTARGGTVTNPATLKLPRP